MYYCSDLKALSSLYQGSIKALLRLDSGSDLDESCVNATEARACDACKACFADTREAVFFRPSPAEHTRALLHTAAYVARWRVCVCACV